MQYEFIGFNGFVLVKNESGRVFAEDKNRETMWFDNIEQARCKLKNIKEFKHVDK